MSRDFSRLKREGGISLEMPQQKRASSRFERRISWFFSSGGSNLGVPVELQWGPQGSACVASGKASLNANCEGSLEILLQAVQWPISSSRVKAGTSGFLSSADMDLGLPMEFQRGCQASSLSESWKSAFLSSFKISVRLPLELT